jgi:serine/threonine-protein kinase
VDVTSPARAATAARPGQLWHAGTLLGGRYRLAVKIGAGAMGEVWRAEHLSLGTTVAMKLVDTRGQDDATGLLARFQLEARSAAQLKSPHVVQILDHGIDGSIAFIAMEMLEGESLEQRLERRGTLLPAEVAHVLGEMARGVERAHAAGIIHRDLKPPNVFLAQSDGREIVKVLDFGIAKLLSTPRDAHLQTQNGFVVGTPAYMSPEQVLGKELGVASDLWQMGIIAFECLTGRRPFDGETLGQLFVTICSAPLPKPSDVARVPPGFDTWFARAASREPSQRFRSATELAEALRAVLAPGGVGEAAIATLASLRRSPAGTPLGADDGAPRGPGHTATGASAAWSGSPAVRPRTSTKTLLLVGAPLLAGALAAGLFWTLHGDVTRAPAAAPASPSTALIVAAPTVAAATVAAATNRAPAPAPSTSAPVAVVATIPSASAPAVASAVKRAPLGPRPTPVPRSGDPDFGF